MASLHYKILIIGPSWIGDMVMAQTLFIELKRQKPNASIDVLALAWTQPLLERMPEVNQAIEMPLSHGVLDIKTRYRLGKQLRSTQYDQAIVLPNSWKSALIPFFADIPLRTGWKGEARYGLLNDLRLLDKAALPLMVDRFVALAHPSQTNYSPQPCLPPQMKAKASSFDIPAISPEQQRIILCPGAEFGPAKQWPDKYYAAVAKALCAQGKQVLILGSKADSQTAQIIYEMADKPDTLFPLAGDTLLAEAIDLLGSADLVLSNDSGLMHIAAALQIPLIVVYGATSPDFTPPLSENSHILRIAVDCGPCFQRVCPEAHHNCMNGISSDDVLQLIDTVLQP